MVVVLGGGFGGDGCYFGAGAEEDSSLLEDNIVVGGFVQDDPFGSLKLADFPFGQFAPDSRDDAHDAQVGEGDSPHEG